MICVRPRSRPSCSIARLADRPTRRTRTLVGPCVEPRLARKSRGAKHPSITFSSRLLRRCPRHHCLRLAGIPGFGGPLAESRHATNFSLFFVFFAVAGNSGNDSHADASRLPRPDGAR